MMLRTLSVVTVAMALTCGATFAKTTKVHRKHVHVQTDPVPQRVISDPEIVGRYFADRHMFYLAPPYAVAAQWQNTPSDLRRRIRADCRTPESPWEFNLCAALSAVALDPPVTVATTWHSPFFENWIVPHGF